jgi:hypothetical protein
MAADEGFEPSQTESESGVLPLHQSAKFVSRYSKAFGAKSEGVVAFLQKKLNQSGRIAYLACSQSFLHFMQKESVTRFESSNASLMVAEGGFEPPTSGL